MNDRVENQDWVQVASYRNSPGVDAAALANRQALAEAYDQLPLGNYQPFYDLLDPEVVFHEAPSLPYGGSYHGREAALRAFGEVSSTYSALRAETHEILTAGEYCISLITITFRIAVNGNTGTMQVTEIFRFKNGEIVDWRVNYHDAAMVAEALRGTCA